MWHTQRSRGKMKTSKIVTGRRAVGQALAMIVLLALIAVAATYYYEMESAVAGNPFSGSPTPGIGPVRSFTLMAEDFGYNGTQGGPTITVNHGDTVRITLVGTTSVSHNLRIDEFNFRVGGEFGVVKGEKDTGEFVATTPGTYTYYCRTAQLGGHESLGQEGTLIVK